MIAAENHCWRSTLSNGKWPAQNPEVVGNLLGRAVKSADGLVDGEIVGIPAPSSKFYKLQIGMKQTQVENLIGQPDRTDSRVTGKQFQPFYFGGDTQRTEVFYKHDGQLTFSNTQVDSAADTLIRIAVDPDAGESR